MIKPNDIWSQSFIIQTFYFAEMNKRPLCICLAFKVKDVSKPLQHLYTNHCRMTCMGFDKIELLGLIH